MSGVETRVFGGVGIWGVGRGRRGKKRRAAEGGKGKDDARWRTRRWRTEWEGGRERLAVAVGRRAGEQRGVAKDAK